MELQLKIIGVLLSFLALVHLIFPIYFNWKKELQLLSSINRQLMIVHTFFIALTILLMGVLCFSLSYELIHTKFGKNISFGLGVFWGVRLIVQFFGYSSNLWKGKKFETIVHVLFSFLWTYLTYFFFAIYFR